ncbi:hypothetical protein CHINAEXTREME_20690 (plasmid) [Halobiforma lacisalsi AJ5]|uniref:Uncharacterized protein n=1 Tax=Natronobacterium lacisalsi AJ5 TaxID=358396 RepID=M0L9B0_NATLA|nr:hypothetical protein [Halobiforma lacisalsi]APX00229.1 hypothetical protein CHINAEXTREME_20690 [Halobiforma lacisalsi AJ5]EMA30161.1 hypothetical protein C445_16684 [Halobiforma lacisalsi AJ5]
MTGLDPEKLETVKELLLEHRGRDNPISSREINEVIEVDSVGSFPKTRKYVRQVLYEEEIPVASGSNGYYVIEDQDELEEEISSIDRRIGILLNGVLPFVELRSTGVTK